MLYFTLLSQVKSALLCCLIKSVRLLRLDGCFVQNGINLLLGPDWDDWLESDNQSGISLNLRTGPTGHETLFNQ